MKIRFPLVWRSTYETSHRAFLSVSMKLQDLRMILERTNRELTIKNNLVKILKKRNKELAEQKEVIGLKRDKRGRFRSVD